MIRAKTRTTGDVIRDARTTLRFTQTDFATELGVSRRTLSRWESDVTRPTSEELPWIVRVFQSHNQAVGERVAGELGVPVSAGSSLSALDGALAVAAVSAGATPARMRDALRLLTARWRDAGVTLEDVIVWLGSAMLPLVWLTGLDS